MTLKNKRLREIDFLRGIAILLVLLRHQYLFTFTSRMGWIGVDLFFVLSGFLVSGLLFKEYIKFGDIKPKLFLIRRGFKIYPIYFLFYLLYLFFIFSEHRFEWKGFLSDMFFIQNYVNGWGYAYAASWSLAVEEHFYFGFALLLWLSLKFNFVKLEVQENAKRINKFEVIILSIMLIVFLLRVYNNVFCPENFIKNFTMTHLRVDSLIAGVLISYLYYFKINFLKHLYFSNKIILIVLAILCVSFTPLTDPLQSFFIKTLGFSLLYISFSIVLIYFLLENDINKILNRCFSSCLVTFISKVGYSSYSIYIIHTFINRSLKNYLHLELNHYLMFIVTSLLSIFSGILMTNYIEKYFLTIRDKYYPSRIA
ncbi:acyltransferase family protein [Flavobacterium sp.]|jgi:peptidoglycan/LPS O-acetylase OafA/YrhL|uniref:acyltransferase family protein n=1 Tax=Flavobacterium sp. TaxID=239 RepID=UPI0037C06FE5